MKQWIWLCFAMLMLAAPAAALAQSPATDTGQVEEHTLALSRRIMSPFCPGRTLASCTSFQAHEWIDEIREMVARGMTDEQIYSNLQERVPDTDISGKPGGGWNTALPILAILLVTGGLAFCGVSRGAGKANSAGAPTRLRR